MSEPRALIIEDKRPVDRGLAHKLRRQGVAALTVHGLEGIILALAVKPDLVILNMALPRTKGVELCRILRQGCDGLVILLTAARAGSDAVVGLTIGTDGRVTKLFPMAELLARMLAVLRPSSAQAKKELEGRVRLGHLTVDLLVHQVAVGGKPMSLSPKEYELLTMFAQNPGRVLSREMLLEKVWGEAQHTDPRAVDAQVRRLRQKIEKDPSNPTLIQTVRGVGYRFGE